MAIYRFAWPSEKADFVALLDKLNIENADYAQKNCFDLLPPEIIVLTDSDMPARDLPASVYLGQLQSALDALGYRAEFDNAAKSASAQIKSWLRSGGELLTDDPAFEVLIPANKRARVFMLAATL